MLKGSECEYFRINSGVKQVYHVLLALQCIYGCSDEGGETGDGEGGVRFQEGRVASCIMQMTLFCMVSRKKT